MAPSIHHLKSFKMNHDFNFDDAMSVKEFYADKGVKKSEQKFLLKSCTSEKGEPFTAVGFTNGEELDDGRPAYTFFVLSKRLQEEGETLNKSFLKEHKDDLQLLEPIDGLKFGIAFLAGGAEDWNDL